MDVLNVPCNGEKRPSLLREPLTFLSVIKMDDNYEAKEWLLPSCGLEVSNSFPLFHFTDRWTKRHQGVKMLSRQTDRQADGRTDGRTSESLSTSRNRGRVCNCTFRSACCRVGAQSLPRSLTWRQHWPLLDTFRDTISQSCSCSDDSPARHLTAVSPADGVRRSPQVWWCCRSAGTHGATRPCLLISSRTSL